MHDLHREQRPLLRLCGALRGVLRVLRHERATGTLRTRAQPLIHRCRARLCCLSLAAEAGRYFSRRIIGRSAQKATHSDHQPKPAQFTTHSARLMADSEATAAPSTPATTGNRLSAPPRRRGVNKAWFVCSVLNPAMHNSAAFRTGSRLCPGRHAIDLRAGDLARRGNAEMLRRRLARFGGPILEQRQEHGDLQQSQLGDAHDAGEEATHGCLGALWCLLICRRRPRAQTRALAPGTATVRRSDPIPDQECNWRDADEAARNGHVEVLKVLLAHGVRCSSQGADWAVGNGHIAVVDELWASGTICSSWGAGAAVRNGHLDMVLYLEARGMKWSASDPGLAAAHGHADVVRYLLAQHAHGLSDAANPAAENGHLEVVRILREYGIHCTSQGADGAAANGHLHVVRDLRAHRIHCTSRGADRAAAHGHLEVVRDLRAHGIHCTPGGGANWAAGNGHLAVVRDLRAHGIDCTDAGADLAAANGFLEVIQDLRAHGIHCTFRGANGAAVNGLLDVVRDLRAHGIHCTELGVSMAENNGHDAVARDIRLHSTCNPIA